MKKEVSAEDKYIKWFSELSNKDISIGGGKGASLSEMYNNKFPVPPGFIVTAQSFSFLIAESGLKDRIKKIIQNINMEDTDRLNKASKEIREIIESRELPKEMEIEILDAYHILSSEKIDMQGVSEDAPNILKNSQEPIFVSVRSSATTEDLADASFAGQQESFLNIKGDKELLIHIKKCFSSLYTPRAMYYRNKKGFQEEQSLLAVVVQKMIDSEKSGVTFSRDPINLNDDIIIEAVYGLGEGIVSGKIKPDHYVVSRDLNIKEATTAEKKIAIVRTSSGKNDTIKLTPERSKSKVLNSGKILELANYAMKLESHYKKPQDIEWAIESDRIYIVQSRPITTLDKKIKAVTLSGKIILEGSGGSQGIGVGTVKIIKGMEDLSKIKKGDVLVTEMTNPDMVVSMQKSVAIITDEGGMTSHASIVSREMGIPAVIGTGNATSVLKDGMIVTVDGTNGKVYEGKVAETKFREIKPAVNTNKIKLKVMVDLPEFAEHAAKTGIDSVGLLRLECIIASSGKHPILYEKENTLEDYTKILKDGIEKIAHYFKKVWIRSSDIRTDEYGNLKGAPELEINPMLGFHGIRFSLKHLKIFEAELLAIKKIAEKYPDKRFGVMFPQVISLDEVREAKKIFNKFKTLNMDFGVMIETPAAVQVIEDICKEGINFISFGTNDLTQFTLAIDRGNSDIQYLYNEMNPAILSQLKRVIEVCKRYKVETSICGQAGSKKEMVEFLFKNNIDSISVNADAAYEISIFISKLEGGNSGANSQLKPLFQQQNNQQNNQQKVQQQNNQNNRQFNNKNNSWKNKKFRKKFHQDFNKENTKMLNEIKRTEKKISGFKENIGPIEPLNDLDRIEKESEKIQEKIERLNKKELEKKQNAGANIEASIRKVNP